MSRYRINKANARTRSTKESLTDQGQAKTTDINVIIGQFLNTGMAPGNVGSPMWQDFTQLPQGLRGMIECARNLEALKRNLPAELQNIPTNQLLQLTPEQIRAILQPPEQPPAQPEGNPSSGEDRTRRNQGSTPEPLARPRGRADREPLSGRSEPDDQRPGG